MVNVTLDDRDLKVLERLREGDADVDSLAADVDCPPRYLRRRLPELADNGLVHRIDDGEYALTENGERAVSASPAGTMDDRIDTPPDVQRQVESFDLRADREAAILLAFAFLRDWGTASAGELIDGVYSEHPAGYESRERWWRYVRDHLGGLPSVEQPDAPGFEWQCTGTPSVDEPAEDGRIAPDDAASPDSSARFALERLDRAEAERSAVRAAFDRLVREGEATGAELRSRVYPDHDAGYESAGVWWADCVRPAFEALPGVERADGDVWQYRQTPEGPRCPATRAARCPAGHRARSATRTTGKGRTNPVPGSAGLFR